MVLNAQQSGVSRRPSFFYFIFFFFFGKQTQQQEEVRLVSAKEKYGALYYWSYCCF